MKKRRAITLGPDLFFMYPLWIKEFEQMTEVQAIAKPSVSGDRIVYERWESSPYITLTSEGYGWLNFDDVDTLQNMYLDKFTDSYELAYDDGTNDYVRFAREKQIKIVPLYEGSTTYRVEIPLAIVSAGSGNMGNGVGF